MFDTMNSPNRNLAIVKAVREQKRSPSQVTKQFGISRQRVYQILNAFDTGGTDAIAPRSRAPRTHPKPCQTPCAKTSSPSENNSHATDSTQAQKPLPTTCNKTANESLQPRQSAASSPQQDLFTPAPKKTPKSSFIRFEAAMPNECWQADITHLYLADTTRIEVLDFLDDHSRYLLSITAAPAFSGTQVAEELSRLITEYGPPASTLTDNGLVFTARLAGRKGGRNAFEKVLTTNKIQQKNGRPGHPQTQGKIERFHQTLKKWITARPLAKTVAELQKRLDEFRDYYNTTRPHKALGRRTPHHAYTTGAKASPAHNPTQEWRTRNDVVWDRRQNHRALRRQTLPPRHRPPMEKTENPHGHRRQPRHHITSRNWRSHHRALHRYQPQLSKALLETNRPTLSPRIRRNRHPRTKRN